MRRFLISTLCLLLCIGAGAYDWVPQSNEDLRSDMIAFAEGFAAREKGTSEGRVLKRFVRSQKKAQTDAYAWIQQTVDAVLALEKMCPPVPDDGSRAARTRRDIMLLLDFPLHADDRSPEATEALKKAFEDMSGGYRAQARAKALDLLSKPVAEGELQVIKVYNCGVLLRTSRRTVAVDIKWEGEREEAERIAAESCAFFLSHPHHDHFSDVMMQALCDAGVECILPVDIAPSLDWEGKKVIYEDRYEPFDVNGIGVRIQTGHQKKVNNNLYLLDFDGWRVMLPGESHELERLGELSGFDAPDLILVPTWVKAATVFEYVSKMKNFDPAKVFCVPEHENEFTHTVPHRESFREMFTRKDRLGDPQAVHPTIVLLEIGESYALRHD